MSDAPPIPSNPNAPLQYQEWAREVFAAAAALRRNGQDKRLCDVTIVLPIDYRAVEAMELACQILAEGDSSQAISDLDRVFDRLGKQPLFSDRFVQSVRSVLQRLSPGDFGI